MVAALVLIHDLFDPPLHHAEVLLGVDVLGLGLVLHVVDLPDVALILLVAFEAVVDTGGGTGRLVEEGLQAQGVGVDGILVLGVVLGGVAAVKHGDRAGVVIVGEVVPAVRIQPGEVEVER